MKKLLISLFIFTSFILNVSAITIKDKSITGPSKTKMGETITVEFNINFDGINKSSMDTEGIWLAGFDLEFDHNFFAVKSIDSPGWISAIYEDNDEYSVMSFPDENYPDKCQDGYLNCGNYNLKIDFYVKDSDLNASAIVMGEAGAGLFKLKENTNEYDTNDLNLITDTSKKDIQIIIEEDEEVVIEEIPSIIEEEIPNIKKLEIKEPIATKKSSTKTTKKAEPTTNNEKKNNDNVYLKSLEVEGYKIKFKKYYADYVIYIDDNVNKLNVKAVAEDEKATVEIIGADNLSENGNKVLVKVTSSNEVVRVYTIRTRLKEENTLLIKLKDALEKNKTLLLISGGIIIALIMLIVILKASYNRKLDKALNHL